MRLLKKVSHVAFSLVLAMAMSIQAFAYVELTWWNTTNDEYTTITLDGSSNGYLSSANGTIRYQVQHQNGTKDTYTNRNNGFNPTADDILIESGLITFTSSDWSQEIKTYNAAGTEYTSSTISGSGTYFFQQLLEKGKGADILLTIWFGNGTYLMNGPFRIYSYSTLTAESSAHPVLKKNSLEYYFINADDSDAQVEGYDGTYGVHISKLIFEMAGLTGNAMKFTHANFYTITDCVFCNGRVGHTIELNAMKNVVVDNCSFENTLLSRKDGKQLTYSNMQAECNGNYNHEVIQIEGDSSQRHADLSTRFGREITVGENSFTTIPLSHDNTVSLDITVKNCRFTNVLRAIGHHYFNNSNGGVYQTNIKLQNNTFENVLHHAIFLQGYKNIIVEGNRFYKISSTAVGGNRIQLKSCVNNTGTGYLQSTVAALAGTNYYKNSAGNWSLLTNNTSDQRIVVN